MFSEDVDGGTDVYTTLDITVGSSSSSSKTNKQSKYYHSGSKLVTV